MDDSRPPQLDLDIFRRARLLKFGSEPACLSLPGSAAVHSLEDIIRIRNTRVDETFKGFKLEECLVKDERIHRFDAARFESLLKGLSQECQDIKLGTAGENVIDLKNKLERLRDGLQAIQNVCGVKWADQINLKTRLRSSEKILDSVMQQVSDIDKRCSSLCAQCQSIFSMDHLAEDPWYELTLLLDVEVSSCALCRQLRAHFISPLIKESGREAIQVRYRINLNPKYYMRHYTLNFVLADDNGNDRPELVYSMVNLIDVDNGDKVANIPLPVQLEPNTSSKKSLQQADDWLRTCRKNHRKCQEIDSEPKRTPKRLVYIESTSPSMKVRLCETRKIKKKPHYMALSHCWGKTLKARLVRQKYDAYLKEIPQEALPQVFRDTFQLASRAGINYVWIDSLCIVQDSPNKEDWRREAATMGSIYRHSYCNVAATGFSNGDKGLFVSRNPDLLQPVAVEITDYVPLDVAHLVVNGGGEGLLPGRYLMINYNTWNHGIEDAPLNLRGWVVQERRLSVRTLHFGSEQVFWECPELQASEVWHMGLPYEVPVSRSKFHGGLDGNTHGGNLVEGVSIQYDDRIMKEIYELKQVNEENDVDALIDDSDCDSEQFQEALDERSRRFDEKFKALEEALERQRLEPQFGDHGSTWGMPNRHRVWRSLVQSYSGCELTFPTDKLIAVSGLARILNDTMRCQYLAGMWKDNLIHQLAWKVVNPKPKLTCGGRGPSWSWASVDGAVEMPYWDANPTADKTTLLSYVLDSSSKPSDGKDTFSFVDAGQVRILGSLGIIKILRPHTNDEEMQLDEEDAISIFWDTTTESQIYGRTQDRRRLNSPRKATPNTVVQKVQVYKGPTDINGTKDIFFLPTRMMGTDVDVTYDITLMGLLLCPTGQQRGQFRRIGQFEAYQQQFRDTEMIRMFERLKRSTMNLAEESFIEYDGMGQYVLEIV